MRRTARGPRPVGRGLDAESLALERDAERVAVRLLVVDNEDERGLGHDRRLPVPVSLRSRVSIVGEGQHEAEGRAFAFDGLDRDLASVRLRDVAHDREPEAGAAGGAAARLVDPVEALEDPLEVARSGCRCPRSCTDEPTVPASTAVSTSTGSPGSRVLDRVVEQVRDRTHHLAAVAGTMAPGAVVDPQRRSRAATAAGRTRSTASSTRTRRPAPDRGSATPGSR